MADPIGHCLERLYLLDDPKLKPRAEQFNGKLSKLPAKIFEKGPNCKTVICIQLAHESFKKQGWDNKLAAQLAGCTAKNYESALSIVRQRLDIQPSVTFEHLAVALGSTTMMKHIQALWETFGTKYQDELRGAKKMNAQKELESPCWKGAIVFVCAKTLGEHLNKEKLHSLCACSITELNRSIKVVSNVIKSDLEELKNNTKIESKKQKNDKNENGEEQEASTSSSATGNGRKRKRQQEEQEAKPTQRKAVSGIASMINPQDYKETKKYASYLNWQNSLVKKLKKSLA